MVVASLLLPKLAVATGVEPLTRYERAHEICLGLRPSERLQPEGSPAKKAAALVAFEEQRELLRGSRLAVELRWEELIVSDWNREAQTIALDTERPLRALGGKLSLFDLDHESLELQAIAGEEERLEEGLRKGKLTLALLFQPAEDDSSPCTVSKLGEIVLAVDLLGAELRNGSRPVARAVGGDFEPVSPPSKPPRVEIRAADLEQGRAPAALVSGLQAASPAILACYARALARDPRLDGTLILQVSSTAAGKVSSAELSADSLQDPETAACVREAILASKVAGPASGAVVVELGTGEQDANEKGRAP
jgi:hypothetical protein